MGQKAEWQILKKKEETTETATAAAEQEDPNRIPLAEEKQEIMQETIQRSSRRPETRNRDYGRQSADGAGARVVPENECVQRVKFPAVQESLISGHTLEKIDYLRDVDLEVSVELGNTVLSIDKILGLDAGAVVELNQTVGEEVRILINGNDYALGEVVVIGEKFGVRISKILHE